MNTTVEESSNTSKMDSRSISSRSPIGVFDSGVGGITVLKELQSIMPNENYIYLGDTARVPYGNKSEELIVQYTRECVSFLKTKGVKLIVIACNTASSYGYVDALHEAGGIPVIEMIRPAAGAALAQSPIHQIAVIGTRGTIATGAYEKELISANQRASDTIVTEVLSIACPLFVPFIEEGKLNHDALKIVASEYLEPIISSKIIETLILGCTHYPFIENVLNMVLGGSVRLLNTGAPAAWEAKNVLNSSNLINPTNFDGKTVYYVTDSPENFKSIAQINLKLPIEKIFNVRLEPSL